MRVKHLDSCSMRVIYHAHLQSRMCAPDRACTQTHTRKTHLQRMTYKIDEVAQALGLGKTTIHKLLRDGELQKIKLGRSTLIPAESVEALLRRHAVQDGAPQCH